MRNFNKRLRKFDSSDDVHRDWRKKSRQMGLLFFSADRRRCRNFIAKSCTSQKGVLVATHTEPCYCFTRLYSPITVARNIKLTL